MDEMWKMLIRHQLTPNQFYLIHSILQKQSPPLINVSLVLRSLKHKNWILEDGEVSEKGKRVVKEVETFFRKIKKKTNTQVMGGNFEENIKIYTKLWPKGKLPSGKAGRSALSNLESPFRWFFDNHNYSWNHIMKATNLYLDEKESKNWKYCRTSQFFIRKQNSDKSWSSEMADYCQLLEDGEGNPETGHFTEKIF